MKKLRWDPCVFQSNAACDTFLPTFLDNEKRVCLLIAGCGFDPRATVIGTAISRFSRSRVRAVFLREERPNPQPRLRERADQHQNELRLLLPETKFLEISVFDDGKTVVGGRRAVAALAGEMRQDATDILIDISALSAGIFFPLVRAALALCDERRNQDRIVNLHVFTVEEPSFDHRIRGMPGDSVTFMHGYRSDESLEGGEDRALLWLPTLAPGSANVLNRIHTFISRSLLPIDVCPIVPFPAEDPRLPDRLAEEYRESLSSWKTDGRSFLYAAESDPLDCYRTICSICDARERTFDALGGSSVILSPVGNKLLAVGAMMAAIERNLPVAMVESLGYDEDVREIVDEQRQNQTNHIWLAGEAYCFEK